jgi:hypothetical protein
MPEFGLKAFLALWHKRQAAYAAPLDALKILLQRKKENRAFTLK